MRDSIWLQNRLIYVWDKYFSDIEKKNDVIIRFGSRARTRLGSIRYHNKNKFNLNPSTEIRLTGFFVEENVPEYIIDLTIAHELCHYAHGFFSPHPALSRFPHKGGVVDNELKERGFTQMLLIQKKWLKEVWPKIIGPRKRKARKRNNLFYLFRI